ncbi:hypothetical protein [Flavobacterium sp.]|uniref:hypothetical protein n=1 Tax=Flavobacterium sp. TaxID=239 RepID=UPI0039E3E602
MARSKKITHFDKNVFINCPFDEDYLPLLKVILYVISKIGLTPRIASERNDSGEVRLSKIKELIQESKYSIHDLSRAKSSSGNEYFRLNMPFELGIDYGCKQYHSKKIYRTKKFLIFEGEKDSMRHALSDMAGTDCRSHKNDAEMIVTEIRNWLSGDIEDLLPPSVLWDDYMIFYTDFYAHYRKKKFQHEEINRLPLPEFLRYLKKNIA